MTRLPFLIEDLKRELQAICGHEVRVAVVVDSKSYLMVQAELESHYDRKFMNGIVKVGDVRIMDGIDT